MTNKEFLCILSSEEIADAILNNDILNAVILSPVFSDKLNNIEDYTELKKRIIQWLDSNVEES